MYEQIDTDVLIIGGGVAGCVAAIRAREAGASVLIVDKVRSIRRSGDGGQWIGFLTTYLETGEETDSPDLFEQWYGSVCDHLVDMKVARKIGVELLPKMVNYLEKLGMPLKNPKTGDYLRMKRPWTPGAWTVVFDGHDFKPILAQRATEAGAQVVGGVHITSLLQDDSGRVIGAVGFDVRTCRTKVFKAGAVILAAGNAERVIHTASRNPFNSYHRAHQGATGYVLALKAGAEAANLEFLGSFLMTKSFEPAVMGTLAEGGARLINGLGQDIFKMTGETGERKFGIGVVANAAREVLAGRGPLFMDCGHLPQEKIDELLSYISYDGPVTLEFIKQSGLDVGKDLVEKDFFVSTWSATASPKGIVVDDHCQSRIPGLFLAGDIATPCYACMGSVSTGYVSGESAARFAKEAGPGSLNEERITAEEERIQAPLDVTRGIPWTEFEPRVRDTMTKYVGTSRTKLGMTYAAKYLEDYTGLSSQLQANNGHELMRTLETIDILYFDRAMTAAALERDESRFQYLMGHYRADHPEKDEARWKGIANVVRMDGDKVVVERRDMNPSMVK